MHPAFASFIEALEPKFQELVQMAPVQFSILPRGLSHRGVYLFSEGAQHLYVGRTNNIRKRLQNHCRPSGTHNSATFAFRIARGETGMHRATYRVEGSRAALCSDPVFGPAFDVAKKRVAAMDTRFVAEESAVCQALLELYVATVLVAPYNDFENH